MADRKIPFLPRTDPSVWSLIFANLLTIAFAIKFNWSPLELIWIYWSQSVTIGVTNYIKMRRLETSAGSRKAGFSSFFLLHYGFFHFIYLLFILAFTFAGEELPLKGEVPIQWFWVMVTVVTFILNHFFSYFYNRKQDQAKASIDRLFFFPYARIVPMHLTLIFGAGAEVFFPGVVHAPLYLFLSLKTVADVVMHKIEHA
jgi:hypothetical protein